jgi:CheY-like chemotaxis protein
MKRGFTLLLAEDDENDIVFFRQALEEAAEKATVPVRLEVTPNGEEAIRYLKGEGEFSDRAKHPFPQIIVTDLKMPRLTGLDVLAWLKEHEEYQRVPKILLSASSEEHEVDEAYRLGVNTFFQKPVSLNQFRDLVYHLVGYWAHTERPVVRHPVA